MPRLYYLSMDEPQAVKPIFVRTLIVGGAISLLMGIPVGFYLQNWSFGLVFAFVAVAAVWAVAMLRAGSRTRALQSAEEFLDRPRVPIGVTSDGVDVYAADLAPRTRTGAGQVTGTNTFALLSLIFGVLGGVLAIPFGHIARSQIRRTHEAGAGMALAGLILGYSWLAAVVAFFIFVLVMVATGK